MATKAEVSVLMESVQPAELEIFAFWPLVESWLILVLDWGLFKQGG